MKTHILKYLAVFFLTSAMAYGQCDNCAEDARAEKNGSGIDGILAHYFGIQKALAADSLSAAKSGAEELVAHQKQSPHSVERKECCLAVNDSTHAILNAVSIKDARSAFKALSDSIIQQVKQMNIATSESHLAYCPMAFGNTGAYWLQEGKSVANPYFGSRMFSCGVIKQAFSQIKEAKEALGR